MERWRPLVWRHPEWWALGMASLAWAMLLAANLEGFEARTGRGHHHLTEGGSTWILSDLAHWHLMVLAMMIPVVVPSLRVAAFRSFWRRRHRAIAGFLVGYLAVWTFVGLAVCGVLAWTPRLTHEWRSQAAAGAFLLAAGWQWSRIKRRALVACHGTIPLAPKGPRASCDCMLFGWQVGRWCALACSPLMVACTFTGHSSLALVTCAWIGLVERYSWRPCRKLITTGILGLAVVFGSIGIS